MPPPAPPVAAFTLLELLVVLGVLALLLGLAHHGWEAARQQSARQQARAELAVLAFALESYHRAHGAYPSTHDGTGLWSALIGEREPEGGPGRGQPFLDPGAHHLRWPDPAAPGNELLDPWGEPYRYHAVVSDGASAYVLYSCGPDLRAQTPDATGQVDLAHPDNRDNLYAPLP